LAIDEALEKSKEAVKQTIITAVENRDKEGLVEALQEVNELFTRPGRATGELLLHLIHFVEEFLEELERKDGRGSQIFYINDGGISRLQIDTLTGSVRLELTASSDDKLKAEWNKY